MRGKSFDWLVRQLAAVAPGSTIWRSNKARRAADLNRDRRRWDEAERQYKVYLSLNPNRGDIWIQLGHALKEQGKVAEAFDAYARANVIDPQDADALLHMGYAKLIAGDRSSAIDRFLEATLLGEQEAAGMAEKLLRERGPRRSGAATGPMDVTASNPLDALPFETDLIGSGAFPTPSRLGSKSELRGHVEARIAHYGSEIFAARGGKD